VYMLDGQRRHVHMDHDPGREIPIRDGQVVIDAPARGSQS
jgi:uncharacterized protein YcfJ